MALRVACSLLLVGGAQGVLRDTTCLTTIQALFSKNTAANNFNADSPRCTLPDPDVVDEVAWKADVAGSVFTTRDDADEVCASMTVIGAMNMCADPCLTRLKNTQAALDRSWSTQTVLIFLRSKKMQRRPWFGGRTGSL